MSDMDSLIAVFFRREHDALELTRKGKDAGRWLALGSTLMSHLPEKGEFIWLNGISYVVVDRCWSIRVSEFPGQPCFEEPQVMLTLSRRDPDRGNTPDKDFREQ